jgi:hypothetical protein
VLNRKFLFLQVHVTDRDCRCFVHISPFLNSSLKDLWKISPTLRPPFTDPAPTLSAIARQHSHVNALIGPILTASNFRWLLGNQYAPNSQVIIYTFLFNYALPRTCSGYVSY